MRSEKSRRPKNPRRKRDEAGKKTREDFRTGGICTRCNRPRSTHVKMPFGQGDVCNNALLSDGRWVHVSRIEKGGDLHEKVAGRYAKLKVKARIDGKDAE